MTLQNIHRWCWKQYSGRVACTIALFGAFFMTAGCDTDAPITVEEVPEFEGELILADEQPASGGAMTVTLEIAPPDAIDHPANPSGVPVSEEEADIHFEAQIRYTSAILGGRNAGDFVPYLHVVLNLTNRDSGETMRTPLVPHVGIAEGYHYAKNLALVDTLGASEAGYDAEVTITAPDDYGMGGMSAVSPGLIRHSDISPTDLSGTVLGPTPVVVSGSFLLGDFKTIVSEDVGGGYGAPAPAAEEEAGGGYAY